MSKKYLLHEQSAHTQVFLIQADSENEAWIRYLAEEHQYLQQPDGAFRHEGYLHENLQEVLDTWGLIVIADGVVIDPSDNHYSTLQDAFIAYNVSMQKDGTYISYGAIYSSVFEALEKIYRRFHRMELQECEVDNSKSFQTLFVSKDELDYLANPTTDEIAHEHNKQADRYVALGNYDNAIQEIEKVLLLVTDRRDKISAYMTIARLYRRLNRLKEAEMYYRQAWETSLLQDAQEQIALCLAETLDELGEFQSAISFYQLSVDLALPYAESDDKEIQKALKRIDEIKTFC